MRFQDYDAEGFYDEWMAAPGKPDPRPSLLVRMLESLPAGELSAASRPPSAPSPHGITFAVYGTATEPEKFGPSTSFRAWSSWTNGSASTAAFASAFRS